MTESANKLEFKFERTIPANTAEVFDAWLDHKVPGNPWHIAEKFLLDVKVDGLFYWATKTCGHYGRFTKVERPARLEHTWVSPNTHGEESTVVVTFEARGDDTLMTLVHSGLPDSERGRGHETGWNWFLDSFPQQFATANK